MAVGYIKLHRQLLDNKMWQDRPFAIGQAWVDLLMKASWTGHEVWKNSTALSLERGQLATTVRSLAREWGWSREKTGNYLKSLQTSAMITTENRPHLLIITISNYDTYQSGDEKEGQKKANNRPKTGQRPANDRPTTGQRPATLLQDKKGKEGEEGEEVPASPTPPPLTAASAPPDGKQTKTQYAEVDPPLPASVEELVNSGRVREAIPVCIDAGCLFTARRLAMKLGDLKEIARINRHIGEKEIHHVDPPG
jgi:hypothetical protein